MLFRILLLGMVSLIASAQSRTVPLCYDTYRDPLLITRASALASKIFAPAGVELEWHYNKRSCPKNAFRIHLREETLDFIHPAALGYSTPYEGVHIEIFYDRIVRMVDEKRVPTLLAYTLVHETTHMLQGVIQHSDSGIMKAHWDRMEYGLMSTGALNFEPRDVTLIQLGLKQREQRLLATSSRR
jgi:hypothetical protein